MKSIKPSILRIEDIMTPRTAFKVVGDNETERAPKLAEKYDYDAIPVVRRGAIIKYWDRKTESILPIIKKHRVPHDASIEQTLPHLNNHLIQFVCYRSEVVGLVDLSDLNKPMGRLPWLHPMLEFEQYIVNKADGKGFTDEQILTALGKNAAKSVRKRRENARSEDLVIPLLAFAQFSEVLNAAVHLGIVQIEKAEIHLLVDLRNKLAHAGRILIENRKTDGMKLLDGFEICRRLLAHA